MKIQVGMIELEKIGDGTAAFVEYLGQRYSMKEFSECVCKAMEELTGKAWDNPYEKEDDYGFDDDNEDEEA